MTPSDKRIPLVFNRILLIVLDSLGVGVMPDAPEEKGANTLGNIAKALGGLSLPHMGRLGLGNITRVKGVPRTTLPEAFWGKAALASPNKDTISGHWEMMGAVTQQILPTYGEGFPREVIDAFCEAAGVEGILGNKPASGTEIIKELGEEHMRTGRPIVYTSADSVFQIAAHEEVIPLPRLYDMCYAARQILVGDHLVARVIARPFVGNDPEDFRRTPSRKDFAIEPPSVTVLDILAQSGIPVTGIGKIHDIFCGRGVPFSFKTKDNMDGIQRTREALDQMDRGLIFTNLVDFDMKYGHRNDAAGYGRALEDFDRELPSIVSRLRKNDLLIITADHGNDPTTPSTDHNREYCPILAYHRLASRGRSLGKRRSLADIGATITEIFRLPSAEYGESFLGKLG